MKKVENKERDGTGTERNGKERYGADDIDWNILRGIHCADCFAKWRSHVVEKRRRGTWKMSMRDIRFRSL